MLIGNRRPGSSVQLLPADQGSRPRRRWHRKEDDIGSWKDALELVGTIHLINEPMLLSTRTHTEHVHSELLRSCRDLASYASDSDNQQGLAFYRCAKHTLPSRTPLVRHMTRHLIAQHEDGHTCKLAGLLSMHAAVVRERYAGRQPREG